MQPFLSVDVPFTSSGYTFLWGKTQMCCVCVVRPELFVCFNTQPMFKISLQTAELTLIGIICQYKVFLPHESTLQDHWKQICRFEKCVCVLN